MDGLERLQRISGAPSGDGWRTEDFKLAAERAERLWRQTESLFAIEYGLLADAVAEIDPQFELSNADSVGIRDSAVAKIWGGRNVATCFLKWVRCPATRGVDNPFEPLVEIYEHGGSVNKEQRYVDIHDHRGKMVAGITVGRF